MKALQYAFLALILSVSLISTSCTMKKRVYIENKSEFSLTLKIDDKLDLNSGKMLHEFKYSMDGKSIQPGNIKIYFGKGKWSSQEEKDLNTILQHMTITKEGSPIIYRLPENISIGHGLLIPELIIRIPDLK